MQVNGTERTHNEAFLFVKIANFVKWLQDEELVLPEADVDPVRFFNFCLENTNDLRSLNAVVGKNKGLLLIMLQSHRDHPTFQSLAKVEDIEYMLLSLHEKDDSFAEKFFRYLDFFAGQWKEIKISDDDVQAMEAQFNSTK